MSHQLTFRATPADLEDLETAVAERQALVCLAWRSPEETPKPLPRFSHYAPGREDLKVLLVAPDDLGEVHYEYVPGQRYWTVDALRSPVVELNRCYVGVNAIRPGRLYYRDGYYGEDNRWIQKPEGFCLWAKDLLRTAKKVFKRTGRDYVGKEAAGLAVLS